MKNLFCELLPLNHKIKSLVVVDCCFNSLFGQIDLLFYLKSFLLFKIQKRHRAVSNNTQSNFLFKVLITYAVQCGILKAISKKHFRYSLFDDLILTTLSLLIIKDLRSSFLKFTPKNSQFLKPQNLLQLLLISICF